MCDDKHVSVKYHRKKYIKKWHELFYYPHCIYSEYKNKKVVNASYWTIKKFNSYDDRKILIYTLNVEQASRLTAYQRYFP